MSSDIVHEGLLRKRAEHIRIWRPRYFILRADGTFCGYREKPTTATEPSNNFTVVGAQIIPSDKPRENLYIFVIRGLHFTNVIERTFACNSVEERQKWIDAISETSRNNRQRRENARPTSHAGNNSGGQKRATSFDDFHYLTVLGKGTFGKVILCQEKKTSKFFAMKILKKSVIVRKDEVDHVLTENRVLMKNNHPFVTKMKYSFISEYHLCFVMEYANGGELFFHLSKERVFTEPRACFYAAEITSALGYLHKKDVVYRDLKLENLLLDKDGHVKIADFGLCKEAMATGSRTRTFCGTPEYLAPEVLADRDYDRSVDWWGLGVVSYEMMVGRLPFYNQNHERLFQAIVNDTVKFPRTLSENARSFLSGLLEKDPPRRLGCGVGDVDDVKAHDFFGSIDWVALDAKQVTPPWKPEVTGDTDTRYFEQQFTREPVRLTPPESDQSDQFDEPFVSFRNYSGSRADLAASLPLLDQDTVGPSGAASSARTTSDGSDNMQQ